ncbi:MAG: tetratricopeptide (TPR) repeat protein, partial [Bacillariaceae sp.]|jgi:tetratricopeptide (TPR) repeat protein
VALCDLRMTVDSSQHNSTSSGSRVLQYYKPASLSEENNVSVSGLDLSRDGKELLVSYESDQIYTFPVFPHSQSPRRSATDQLMELLDKDSDIEKSVDNDNDETLYPWGKGKRILPELKVQYGAHLNRFTFLKNATYAGPRDEYICTGSDSGHAWIYEKATGAVVSFWKADQSTCNGVVPHPTLPIFVTYGIDSTAKLWRSTTPVDPEVDDSAIGRRKHFRKTQNQSYDMSPTVRNWGEVQSILENLDLREAGRLEGSEIFPDQIPGNKVLMRRGRMARTWMRESSVLSSNSRIGLPKIGNDLHNLPDALKENLFVVLRSFFDDDDVPVESDIEDFKRRVSLIRLRHQADALGLSFNPTIPWIMEGKSTVNFTQETLKDAPEDHQVDPSELVPEYPSDWIPYDLEMSSDSFDFRDFFCYSKSDVYADFYGDRYQTLDERGVLLIDEGVDVDSDSDSDSDNDNGGICEYNGDIEMKKKSNQSTIEDDRGNDMEDNVLLEDEEEKRNGAEAVDSIKQGDSDNAEQEIDSEEKSFHDGDMTRHANRILAETVKTLKDGGNAAFKTGNLGLAAHRYDKAIQYGSVAYMKNRKMGICRFDELLKNLIMTRLNMALVLLTAHFMEKQIAAKQARLALEEVSPFCDPNNSDNEDIESLDEALALKAKACFRLGSAQYEMGDYSDAIYSLEESIRSTNDISDPIDNIPDSLVLRRLAHAKREHLKHTKRQRKKFKFAFSSSSLQSDLSASTSLPSTPMFSTASRLAPSIPLLSSTTMSPVERIESTVVTATSTATAAPNSTTTVNTANTVTPINSPATTETVATATATSLGAGSTKD